MLPSDMTMSTDIQFAFNFVSALDICLTSFGDARTVRARNADQADYSPLNPTSLRAWVDFVSPRPARGIDGLSGIDGIKGVHIGGSFKLISMLLREFYEP
ncbi:hypothetical protein L3X38_011345 [Prunus dulcis]|uniref:Uncharacterized protein n=1 Tax=Prunus dulcis TaxID=3755 RepID=A0AAD4WHL3_PRUDU|nr:hypothetical protein L3X38_011345 [Prunus dulcis]